MITIFGSFGLGNVGDEMSLRGYLELIGTSVPSEDHVVISMFPPRPYRNRQVTWTRSLHRIVSDEKLVLIGGLLSQYMGPIQQILPFLLSLRNSRTVEYYGGLYPSAKPHIQKLWRYVIMHKNIRFYVRDKTSYQFVKKINPSADVHVRKDLAWEFLKKNKKEHSERSDLVGASFRPAKGIGIDFFEKVLITIEQIGFTPVVMVFSAHIAKTENDLLIAEKLTSWNKMVFIYPEDVVEGYAKLKAVVGMRYHSLLTAEAYGIPYLSIPYDLKCLPFKNVWREKDGFEKIRSFLEAL